mmetsp:Transcript_635/g.1104  ORF Transcript_635/g.1104 Transcript_635/m.1104 type:complete len:91 (-) Transcript_635:202-474(-)
MRSDNRIQESSGLGLGSRLEMASLRNEDRSTERPFPARSEKVVHQNPSDSAHWLPWQTMETMEELQKDSESSYENLNKSNNKIEKFLSIL